MKNKRNKNNNFLKQLMVAKINVLVKGYINLENDIKGKGCSTIVLIVDGHKKIIVDPGTTKTQTTIIDALRKENLTVDEITHVFITHSHLDHYRNLGMFPKAIAVDFWGEWRGDALYYRGWFEKYSAEGNFSKNISIVKTPGHDPTSLTFFVKGELELNNKNLNGVVAICGDVFWKKDFPKIEDEPFATNKKQLSRSRKMILEYADYIIPGHDDVFKV